ncbi:MAG: MarR family winged helix-turn-helix transcriptional regulator [Gemmatimonadaceae bacterium]
MTGDGEGSSDAARAMNAVRRLVRALRVSSRAVERDVGISGAQLFVLRQLAASPGQSLTELVERTLTHQSTVSEVVARLVDRGLVRRRTAADDGRRHELALTARGRALLRAAPATVQSDLMDGFARLDPAQRRAVAAGLEAWLAAAGLAEVPPTLFFERSERGAKGRKAPAGARRRVRGDGHAAD